MFGRIQCRTVRAYPLQAKCRDFQCSFFFYVREMCITRFFMCPCGADNFCLITSQHKQLWELACSMKAARFSRVSHSYISMVKTTGLPSPNPLSLGPSSLLHSQSPHLCTPHAPRTRFPAAHPPTDSGFATLSQSTKRGRRAPTQEPCVYDTCDSSVTLSSVSVIVKNLNCWSLQTLVVGGDRRAGRNACARALAQIPGRAQEIKMCTMRYK